MACKVFCFITDKCFKFLYALLLIVLITLWIVLCIESIYQINEISMKQKTKQAEDQDEERKLLLNSQQDSFVSRVITNRIQLLTVFNTVLEVVIAGFAILSLLTRTAKLFMITFVLLAIVWFIEQYRISDVYHQIDHLEYQSSQLILVTHLTHFFVVILGVILTLTDRFRILNQTIGQSAEEKKFADIEGRKVEGKCEKRFDWMRTTFVRRKRSDQLSIEPQLDGQSTPTEIRN